MNPFEGADGKLLTFGHIFGSYEPTSDRTYDWGQCSHCKQSYTGRYMGKAHCTRCVGRNKSLIRVKSSEIKVLSRYRAGMDS